MKSSPSSSSQTVILGASNCTRIIIDDPNIHNLSVSGTTLDNVQSLLDKSDNEVEADFVKKVVFRSAQMIFQSIKMT
jgi:transcription initiation factor IIF auxiliary subunit